MKKHFVITVIPIILLLLILSYGVLIPWLGFYNKDWALLLSARYPQSPSVADLSGELIRNPVDILNLISSFLGYRPIAWQISSFLLQWISIVAYWFLLRLIWPQRTRLVTWAALIFTVYPLFNLQASPVSNLFVWLSLCFFLISLVCMVLARQRPKFIIQLHIIGVIAQILAFTTLPALIIMELIRPFVLWLTLDHKIEIRRRLTGGLKGWSPYLAITLIFFVFQLRSFNNAFSITGNLLQSIQVVLKSMVNLLFSSWYQAIEPASITLTDRFFLLSVFLSILAGVVTWVFLKRIDKLYNEELAEWNEYLSIIGLGLGFLVVSILFASASSNSLQGYPYKDLSEIVGMYGAGLLIALIIERIISNEARKMVLVSVLVGIGVGYQLRVANNYRWDWVEQTRLFWQMSWRMPNILPKTIFLTDAEDFNNDILSSAAALNFIYQVKSDMPAYWIVNLSDYLGPGQEIEKEDFISPVIDNPDRGFIVITNDTSRGHCLWVLSPTDSEKPEISKSIRAASAMSDLSRIQTVDGNVYQPFQAIFGREPEPTWCTYYQKAELARQSGKWETIVQLGEQLQKSEFQPNSLQEWLPFLEAYIRTAKWGQAERLSQNIYQANPANKTWLCNFLTNLNLDKSIAEDNFHALEQLILDYHCDNPQ